MKLNGLNKIFEPFAKKLVRKAAKHAPEILIGTGIVLGVASTVTACKSTIKAQDILVESKKEIDEIHDAYDNQEGSDYVYPENEKNHDLIVHYAKTAGKLIGMYTPSIVLGGLSIACFISSHGIMRNRVTTLVTAYGTLDTAFRNYRKQVAQKLGVMEENALLHGIDPDDVEIDTNSGHRIVKTGDDRAVRVDGYSIYARCFDEYNPNWKNNPEYNLSFLRGTQRYLQACLERDGYLFLNDVYRELGFEPSQAGQLVGWIYDPKNENHRGDNCVSFGLYNPEHGVALGDFINGNNNAVFLDFNVDGVIIDRI